MVGDYSRRMRITPAFERQLPGGFPDKIIHSSGTSTWRRVVITYCISERVGKSLLKRTSKSLQTSWFSITKLHSDSEYTGQFLLAMSRREMVASGAQCAVLW